MIRRGMKSILLPVILMMAASENPNKVFDSLFPDSSQYNPGHKNEVYPQIPCLVKGQLSTGYGYGVRYWNVECQVWDDEECDDYECDKEAVEEWAYLDDIIGNMED